MNRNQDGRRPDERGRLQNGGGKQKNTPQPKRSKLSPREAAVIAERKRIENAKRQKARKEFLDKLSAITVFAIIGTFISLFLIAAFIFVDYRSKQKVPDEAVIIHLSDKSEHTLTESDYFYRNGEYHVSLTSLCELLPITLHGDVKNMTLSLSDSHYATFDIGTSIVDINGTNCIMSSGSYFELEKLFIPCSFFTRFCNGVTIEHKENGTGRGYNMTFDKAFSIKAADDSSSYPVQISKSELAPVSNEFSDIPDFKADLSDYEQYMNPENIDEYITLINTSHMLTSDYVPGDLVEISNTRKDGRAPQKMRLYAAKALEALFIEMRANGFTDVSVTSGYRSYEYQTSIFKNEVASLLPVHGDKAESVAKTQIAVPGSSEHQSGLCVDMHNLAYASEAFEKQDAYKWLFTNCADFGFILRFPKDKTHITGIIFEPWHYRYVGRYHAQKIMSQGLCLEEYVAGVS